MASGPGLEGVMGNSRSEHGLAQSDPSADTYPRREVATSSTRTATTSRPTSELPTATQILPVPVSVPPTPRSTWWRLCRHPRRVIGVSGLSLSVALRVGASWNTIAATERLLTVPGRRSEKRNWTLDSATLPHSSVHHGPVGRRVHSSSGRRSWYAPYCLALSWGMGRVSVRAGHLWMALSSVGDGLPSRVESSRHLTLSSRARPST